MQVNMNEVKKSWLKEDFANASLSCILMSQVQAVLIKIHTLGVVPSNITRSDLICECSVSVI